MERMIYAKELGTDMYSICPEGKLPVGFVEVTEEEYNEYLKNKEQERIAQLSMRRGDVFEAMLLANNIGKPELRAMIEQAPLDDLTKALYLNRFDEAIDFYRSFPAFDMLGETLGITGAMLDRFFDTKDWHYLTTCKLVINATPEEATVTGAGNYPYSDVAHYKVECEGYVAQEGDIKMMEDEVLEVALDENTGDTTTDVSNEVETESTGEVNEE